VTADAPLIDRLRDALAAEPSTREVKMFGVLSFMLNGKLLVAAHADGGLLVRVDPARDQELTRRAGAQRASMRDREMGAGWLLVDAAAIRTDDELAGWLALAREHNVRITEPSPPVA
jgi:hypothetical protein